MDKKNNKIGLFIKTWDQFGHLIIKSISLLFIITLVSQLLIFFNIKGMPKNSIIDLEGEDIIENLYNNPKGEVNLSVDTIDMSKETVSIVLYINGENKGKLKEKDNYIIVNDKDIIEVRATSSFGYANINILNVSKNMVYPKMGLNFPVGNEIVYIGKVSIK